MAMLCVLNTNESIPDITGERVKQARHYRGYTDLSWSGVCICTYVWKYVCHSSSISHAYVMWVELGLCHFFVRLSHFKCSDHWNPALKLF